MPDRQRIPLSPATDARWGPVARVYGWGWRTSWRDNPALDGDRGQFIDVSIDSATSAMDPWSSVREFHLANAGVGGYVPGSGLRDATLPFDEANRLGCGSTLALLVWAGVVRAAPVRLDIGGSGEWTATWNGEFHWHLHRDSNLHGLVNVPPRPLEEILVDPPANATDRELFRTWPARSRLRRIAASAGGSISNADRRVRGLSEAVQDLEVEIILTYRAGSLAGRDELEAELAELDHPAPHDAEEESVDAPVTRAAEDDTSALRKVQRAKASRS